MKFILFRLNLGSVLYKMYKNQLKPVLDFTVALVAFILLSPVFLVVSLLLAISNNGKPFFFQRRPGKDGKIFKIIKFKSMNDKKDKDGNLLPDYDRLTFVGKIVRKTSLDELPQLLNVLKGDMSLVGPRPLLPEYLPLYNSTQKRRHEVRPGITGWSQVNGRNALSWEEKFHYDVEYVDHVSFLLDMKIILITLEKVYKRHGINPNNYVSVEPFKGSSV